MAEILKPGLLGSIKLLKFPIRLPVCAKGTFFLRQGSIVFLKTPNVSHNPNRFRITVPDLRVEMELSSRWLPRGCLLQPGWSAVV